MLSKKLSTLITSLSRYNRRREKALKKAPEGIIKEFLQATMPDLNSPIQAVDIVSMDFETTGLNAKEDHIISVGLIDICHLNMPLASAYHAIVQQDLPLEADNVAIHQITDQQLSQGESTEVIVETILKKLMGKVLLAHYASIEVKFLQAACIKLYGVAPPFLVIDTMILGQRYFDRKQRPYQPNDLRLSALREFNHLPDFHAHNALNDAIATAELFFVQVNQRDKDLPLKSYLI